MNAAISTMKDSDRVASVLEPERRAPIPSKISMKSGIRRVALLLGAISVVTLGGVYLREWWMVGRFTETTDDAFVGADTTTIASKVPGFVVKVAVEDNQRVRAGDLLAEIDDRDYRAELAREQAVVDGQKAALENLDAAGRLQVALIDQARSRTESTAAERKRAAADGVRSRDLATRRVVSEQDFEQVDATATKARADDEAAGFALVASERQLDVIDTQKRQARASLAQAQAALDLAGLDVGYTEIRSPIDGVVGNRHARVGDYAATGVQMMSVVPSDGLYVEANFKESQIARMRPGQAVEIEADVLRGEKFRGRVESLAPATGAEFSLLPAENATGNFTKIVQRVPIRIRLLGGAAELGRLRPGLSVTASVDQR